MRKFLGIIIFLVSFSTSVAAGYGGWIDMIRNHEEHKYCGDLARNSGEDEWNQTEIYLDCREHLDFQKMLNK